MTHIHVNVRVWVCGVLQPPLTPQDNYFVGGIVYQTQAYSYGPATNPCDPGADNAGSYFSDNDWSATGYNDYVYF